MATSHKAQRAEGCNALQQALVQELRSFAVPLLIAPDLELRPNEVRNATGVFLRVGTRQCLVTCYHVWKELDAERRDHVPSVMVALLADGSGAFHIERPTLLTKADKLRLAEELDLAIFDVTGTKLFGEKRCFPFTEASVHNPIRGDIVVTIGFPGMWRKSEKNYTCVASGPLPFTVSDVSSRSFIVQENDPHNQEVFAYLDAQQRGHNSGDACGGLSGAPAFYVNQKPFKIAGFIIQRALGCVMLARASSLKELME
jgi:hypothetical protein